MATKSACDKLHPHRARGPCAVCHKDRDPPKYWHIAQAQPNHQLLVSNLRQLGIGDTDCICRSCQIKYQNVVQRSNDSCAAKKIKLEGHCCVLNCQKTEGKFHQLHENVARPSVKDILNVDLASCSEHEVHLCHVHYCQLTNANSRKCCLCNKCSNSKNPPSNFRKVQDLAGTVGKYAFCILGIDEFIVTPDNYFCSVCRHVVMKFKDSPQCKQAFNADRKYFFDLFLLFESYSCPDAFACESYSFAQAMLYLKAELSQDNPVLLQTVHGKYCSVLASKLSEFSNANISSPERSQEWLKQQIVRCLGGAVIVSTIKGQSRYGTMIRRFGSDVVEALHRLLFNNQRQSTIGRSNQDILPPIVHELPGDMEFKMLQVADYLNQSLNQHAASVVSRVNQEQLTLDEIDFMQLVRTLPPHIWNFIFRLSLGINERRLFSQHHRQSLGFEWSSHFLDSLYTSPILNKSKFLRRFFICSCLLFCVNRECHFPLNLIISDVIDKFTCSSTECLTILSRFGITVSKDSLVRYQVFAAKKEMEMKPSVLSSSFCVASVDNIDRNSQFAAVTASQKPRGFHGTSVQAVEPLPSSLSSGQGTSISTPIDHQPGEPSCRIQRHERSLSSTQLHTYHQSIPAAAARVSNFHRTQRRFLSCVDDFFVSPTEQAELENLKRKVFSFMVMKYTASILQPTLLLPDLRDCLRSLYPPKTVKSNIHFTAVISKPADKKETLLEVLGMLKEKHQVGQAVEKLVVAGDGKTYDFLIDLQRDYSEELDWVLPYLGEWHLLKNAQAPIFKVYMDGGLRDLLKLYHHGATNNAVSSATNFDKTHQFLLTVWEALYRAQLDHFFQTLGKPLSPALFHRSSLTSRSDYLQLMKDMIASSDMPNISSSFEADFHQYCSQCASKMPTFKFWNLFVHRDMISYMGLYLAIRSRNFRLRNVCVRLLAPVFHALDRHVYLRIIPHSLADLKQFPTHILQEFHAGGFTVSFRGNAYSSVAFDEAHEMAINRNVKMAMTTTSDGKLSCLAQYLPHRARSFTNLNEQIANVKVSTVTASASVEKSREEIICGYLAKIKRSNLYSEGVSTQFVQHLFSREIASALVSGNLLTFYQKGEDSFVNYMKCVVLREPGAKPQKRHRINLTTFTKKGPTVHKQKKEMSDQRLQISCLRKQIALSKSTGEPITCLEQFVALPRALCSPDGVPNKYQKAPISKLYEDRYPDVFTPSLSIQGKFAYVVDGMFLLQTHPVDPQKTFGDYINCLYRRWVTFPMFTYQASEVHIVFDHPNRHGQSPKDIERARRDAEKQPLSTEDFSKMTVQSKLPSYAMWSSFLANRILKRRLVTLIADQFLAIALSSLPSCKTLVIGGAFEEVNKDKAFVVGGNLRHEATQYFCNHEEADTRVWFHAYITQCKTVAVYSPDRDVFNVGLPLIQQMPGKYLFVHLRAKYGDDLYLNLTDLGRAFSTDLGLQISSCNILKALQMLFICSGCDFVSYFVKYTKKRFLETFVRDLQFITGANVHGKLDNWTADNWQLGLLSFYRLIGSLYFRAHLSAFRASSPEEFFDSVSSSNPDRSVESIHINFLDAIREGHFHRIANESEWMPTADALRFHWQRSCWTAQVWSLSTEPFMDIPPFTSYGWATNDGKLSVVWDTPDNIAKVNHRVKLLKSGCACTKGKCRTAHCGCKRANPTSRYCTTNCKCVDCENVPTEGTTHGSIARVTDSGSTLDSGNETEMFPVIAPVMNNGSPSVNMVSEDDGAGASSFHEHNDFSMVSEDEVTELVAFIDDMIEEADDELFEDVCQMQMIRMMIIMKWIECTMISSKK